MSDLTAQDPDRYAPAADLALATGEPVVFEEVLLVPDVVIAEGVANGQPEPPPTTQLARADGRKVYLFQAPKNIGDHVLRWPR